MTTSRSVLQTNSDFSNSINARDFSNGDNFDATLDSQNKQANSQTMTEKLFDSSLPATTFFKKCSTTKAFVLSPITEISLALEDTNLISAKAAEKLRANVATFINDDDDCIIIEDSDEDVDQEVSDSLLSNNFTINSAGRSPSNRLTEQRARGVQRRLNIAPLRMNYDDDKCNNNSIDNGGTVSTEELSFYSGNSPQTSPRPCSVSPCMDIGLLSPETSPNKFSTIIIHDDEHDTISMQERTQQQQQQQPQRRQPLDDHDLNSMDSGYEGNTSSHSNKSVFRFPFPVQTSSTSLVATVTLPTTRRVDPSPRKTPSKQATSTIISNGGGSGDKKMNSFKVYNSLSSGSMESGSMESMDDEYMDLFEMETLDEDAQLPNDLCSLISGDIKTLRRLTPDAKIQPMARRCLSLHDSPLINKARNSLFELKTTPDRLKVADENTLSLTPYSSRIGDGGKCFKRPEPPAVSPIQSKRYKYESDSPKANQENLCVVASTVVSSSSSVTTTIAIPKRPIFKKSISMNDAHIMSALARSSSEPDLIGDFSKPFCLPLIDGRHRDLKSISCDTLAALLQGDYTTMVGSFKIIDCRYPYEFEGGHIRGAQNLYTQEEILDVLVKNQVTKTEQTTGDGDSSMDTTSNMFTTKRNILIFHCEFSSERGPKLSRFLRNNDRMRNEHAYPTLNYPEIYLLHGGYKEFYETHSNLCDPIAYRPMLDASYGDAYRHFRAKSKSWNGDIKATSNNRLVKSRSRLVL